MTEIPQAELIKKLRDIGASPVAATKEVAHAVSLSPSNGAEYLQKLGLNYLEAFKLLSVVANDKDQDRKHQGDGLFSVLFPRRLARGEYLIRYIFFVVAIILVVGFAAFAKIKGAAFGMPPLICIALIALYKTFVLDAARFRDRGKSGFLACVMIFPVANLVAQFYLWFAK